MTRPAHLEVTAADPRRRGEERGRRTAVDIGAAWRTYADLFAVAGGVSGADFDVRELAEKSLAVTRDWAPELVAELEGVAEGADLPLWVIAALNARTEILAVAGALRAGECSTVAQAGASVLAGQSWDWHAELAGAWHVQSVRGDLLGFAGITEYGVLAKIGVNEAGVGLLFNILGHVDDSAQGVPVHLVARKVLGTAASFDDAVAILRGAPVSASTVMTVVTAERSACVEVSPAGVAVIDPGDDGWLVHTNHFLDAELARGELRGRREPETYDRFRLLSARVAGRTGIDGADDLAALLTAHPQDGAEVCCHAPVEGRLGNRWATLATIMVDPAARELHVHSGGPCSARPGDWFQLAAPRHSADDVSGLD